MPEATSPVARMGSDATTTFDRAAEAVTGADPLGDRTDTTASGPTRTCASPATPRIRSCPRRTAADPGEFHRAGRALGGCARPSLRSGGDRAPESRRGRGDAAGRPLRRRGVSRSRRAVRPGVSCSSSTRVAHRMIRERGAASCYIDYHPSFGAMPFGKVLCTSVNDAVLHGLPFDYRLRDGDNVSAGLRRRGRRLGRRLGGHGAASGTPQARRPAMIETARTGARGGHRGGPAGQPHRRHLGGDRGGDQRRRVTRSTPSFGGHGVGRTMHEAPDVPNWGEAGRGRSSAPGS